MPCSSGSRRPCRRCRKVPDPLISKACIIRGARLRAPHLISGEKSRSPAGPDICVLIAAGVFDHLLEPRTNRTIPSTGGAILANPTRPAHVGLRMSADTSIGCRATCSTLRKSAAAGNACNVTVCRHGDVRFPQWCAAPRQQELDCARFARRGSGLGAISGAELFVDAS